MAAANAINYHTKLSSSFIHVYIYDVTPYFPAVPITFMQQLKNMQAEEGSSVILRCEISKPGIPVEWRKEDEVLKNSVKYQIRKRETTLELLIWKPVPEDGGVYSCVCADQMTSATVKITGRSLFTNELIKELL